jgi:hypothetical protein
MVNSSARAAQLAAVSTGKIKLFNQSDLCDAMRRWGRRPRQRRRSAEETATVRGLPVGLNLLPAARGDQNDRPFLAVRRYCADGRSGREAAKRCGGRMVEPGPESIPTNLRDAFHFAVLRVRLKT